MLYIIYVDLFDKDYFGIKKKIFAQIRVFENKFGSVYYTTYSGQMMYLMLNGKILEKDVALTKSECNRLLVSWIEKYSVSKTYIRYDYSNIWFINFLKWQKEKNIKSILEFPTIPYDGELSNKRLITEDKYYREKLHFYVEQSVTYSDDDYVFNIPAIKIQNGVDILEHPLRNIQAEHESINLITVSSLAKWQGYERIINGMAEYYNNGGKKKIYFIIVGRGNELDYYKNLSKKNNIENYVRFYGGMEGEELNKVYDIADLGVGCLGLYKRNGEYATSIKLREYCARGLPFIYGYTDLGFIGNEKYTLKVDNNNSSIDMVNVIGFYDRLKDTKDWIKLMRHKAETEFSWDIILRNVIDYFNG